MLKDRVRVHSDAGEDCSRIILQSAAEEYGLDLPETLFSACMGLNGGFGINGLCGGLIAAVMVLGLLFDADAVKAKRIQFLSAAQERFGALDCGKLSALGDGADCCELLEEIAELLQSVAETSE